MAGSKIFKKNETSHSGLAFQKTKIKNVDKINSKM